MLFAALIRRMTCRSGLALTVVHVVRLTVDMTVSVSTVTTTANRSLTADLID